MGQFGWKEQAWPGCGRWLTSDLNPTRPQACPKVRRILDIWASGRGVVSLHCFQHVVAMEAYTREACLVDALGGCLSPSLSWLFLCLPNEQLLSTPEYTHVHVVGFNYLSSLEGESGCLLLPPPAQEGAPRPVL